MKKTGIMVVALLLVLVGGVTTWRMSQGGSGSNNTAKTNTSGSQRASLETTAAMKAEEAKFRTYGGDDYDRYYIANMIGHHEGAVDMANVALTNAKHSELKTLASSIISAQNKEIATMTEWQQAWGYPASSGENMVDHSAMNMTEDMDMMTEDLKKKTGDEFDKAFLRMMIVHHESAIAMSRPGADNAKHQEVKDLTNTVISDQTKEVLQMRDWHKDWKYGEVPAVSASPAPQH